MYSICKGRKDYRNRKIFLDKYLASYNILSKKFFYSTIIKCLSNNYSTFSYMADEICKYMAARIMCFSD